MKHKELLLLRTKLGDELQAAVTAMDDYPVESADWQYFAGQRDALKGAMHEIDRLIEKAEVQTEGKTLAEIFHD